MFSRLREDVRTVFERDPAARSLPEVIFCYPGLHALWCHRVAHFLWCHHLKFSGRLLSHLGRFFTGIEIHPGARIGRRFFIDHGSGVVIGETAEIGDDVLMYQGTVLGGTSISKGKRHPTLGNNIVVGAGAIVLGNITIGDGAKIGAGAVVVRSVPEGATVVGVPGRIVEEHRPLQIDLEHGHLPDPVAKALRVVLEEQARLEDRLSHLESSSPDEFKEKVINILKELNSEDQL